MATLVENKRAHLKYAALETFAAGIVLSGQEVKALRNKLGSMEGSRIIVRGGEAFLVGMTIPPYQSANAAKDYEPERPRKLLLNKKEIAQLADAESRRGLTTVPFEVYTAARNVKVKVAIVRGKGKADRREDLKRRDADRERERLLKTR